VFLFKDIGIRYDFVCSQQIFDLVKNALILKFMIRFNI